MGVLEVMSGVAIAAVLIAAASYVSRCLPCRVSRRAAGAAAVPPARERPAGGTAVPAVPAVTVQPSSVMTEPFAYSNGLTIGPPPERSNDS